MWAWIRLLMEGIGWLAFAAGLWWFIESRVNAILLWWFVLRHPPRDRDRK